MFTCSHYDHLSRPATGGQIGAVAKAKGVFAVCLSRKADHVGTLENRNNGAFEGLLRGFWAALLGPDLESRGAGPDHGIF